jgi:hypothetical protein
MTDLLRGRVYRAHLSHIEEDNYFLVVCRSAQEVLSIGRQQAEGIEAPTERGYRPEVTLICREDLIGVVTIGEDGVQRICNADLKVVMLRNQASCSAQVIDIKVGNLVGAAGQVVDDRELLINANSVEHHVIDLREYERRDHGWLGDRAQDVSYHV